MVASTIMVTTATMARAYVRPGVTPKLPARPEAAGYRIEHGEVTLYRDIVENGERVGTIHLRSRYGVLDRALSYGAILGGVLFLALMLAAVWATYGVFTQKFSDYDEVTVKASKIGLQLPQRADVKIRGVIVGEVLGYEPDVTLQEGLRITWEWMLSRDPELTGARG